MFALNAKVLVLWKTERHVIGVPKAIQQLNKFAQHYCLSFCIAH